MKLWHVGKSWTMTICSISIDIIESDNDHPIPMCTLITNHDSIDCELDQSIHK